jgi:hypothetical protein
MFLFLVCSLMVAPKLERPEEMILNLGVDPRIKKGNYK